MALLHFNKEGFDKSIATNGVVLADFFATWCGPCKMLTPVVEALADKYDGKVIVGKVDVDENADLAGQFGVMSVPTVIFFKNGEEIDRKVGAMPPAVYSAAIDANL